MTRIRNEQKPDIFLVNNTRSDIRLVEGRICKSLRETGDLPDDLKDLFVVRKYKDRFILDFKE